MVFLHFDKKESSRFSLPMNSSKGKYVLLYSDGGYATRWWKDVILPGIIDDK